MHVYCLRALDCIQAFLISTSVQEVDLISCVAPWGDLDLEKKSKDIRRRSYFWMLRVGREQALEPLPPGPSAMVS